MQVGDLIQHRWTNKFYIFNGRSTSAYIHVICCLTGKGKASPISEYEWITGGKYEV